MKEELELKEGPTWILQDIKKVFQELYDHYRSVVNRNEYLEEEIKKVKDEKYKDEELSKMKESYEKMKHEYYSLGFPITEEEVKKIREWEDKIIGGVDMKINDTRFHYEFYPTPIGVAGYVVDSLTKEKFQFQELG